MQWIAPSEKDTANDALEKRLWEAADQLRANSGLNPQQYSGPVLGLIFLRFAEVRFAKQRATLENKRPATAAVRASMSLQPITPRAFCSLRRTRALIFSSAYPRARTSARS